ncbi:MAG TPA: POTRA domain-containing protein [Kofleriaceae bacterium]|nr:POTRA domain-containing protein [Kofleriaceae bacterium]
MKALVVALAACGGAAAPIEPPPAAPIEHRAPAGPPPAGDRHALIGPVRSIDLQTTDRALAAQARELVAREAGLPIERARLRRELDQLAALPGVGDVIARGVQLEDGIKLVIELVPPPVVHAIAARDHAGGDVALPGELATAVGLPLDRALLEAAAARLAARYRDRGYRDATVGWQTASAGAAVDVTYAIAEGDAYTIDGIELRGNTRVKRAELIKALGGMLPPGTPWVDDQVMHAVGRLVDYYNDHGFVMARIEPPKPTGQHAALVLAIDEGEQFRVGALAVTGVADPRPYVAALGVKSGELFDRSAMNAAMHRLEDVARAHGIARPEVQPQSLVDGGKHAIDVTFAIRNR